jgi:SAM-dependent methyltransferase
MAPGENAFSNIAAVGRRPPARVLVAVGLVAGSTLALQVLLTRLFAAVLYYHFGFMAISLALLGVGAGAIVIYVRPAWFDSIELERALARGTIVYAVLLVVAIAVLVRLNYALGDEISREFVVTLVLACLLSALPLFAAGVVIGLAVRGYVGSIGRVYAFDLAGAGLGAVAVVPVMWVVDVPTIIVALCVVAAFAALLFAGAHRIERRAAAGALAGAVLLCVLAGTTSAFYLPPLGGDPDAERWTPLNRVLGYLAPEGLRNGNVIYDRNFGEIIPYQGGPVPDWRLLQEGGQSIGYSLTPGGDALVIGGGGGRDILAALGGHQKRVDVIELNRGIRDVVDHDLRSFSGGPYSLPRVHTAIGDGRSTLAERDTTYDQIQIGYVDTFSPSGAQAFALTEHNLYTVEAFEEFFDHLKPGGVLNLARPVRHNGEEALRATVLTLDALRRHGVEHPERNVVVLLGDYKTPFRGFQYGTILAKLTPFTPAQLAHIKRLAKVRTTGVAFAPGGPYLQKWTQLAAASSPLAFCKSYTLNVCPPTDDEPFFFNMKRLKDLGGESTSDSIGVPDPILVLAITLAILAGLAALAFVLPLALVGREGRPTVSSLLFFAAIGLGFLVIEVVLIQRFVLFLGFPTYALSVVLFSLLVFTGLGSLLTTRLNTDPRRTLIAALGLASILIAASAYGLQPVLRALIDLPFAVRVVLTVVLLAPLGLTLGMAMPLGLRRLVGLYPAGVPWAWGINGISSVLASVLAIAVAINLGFAITTLVALAFYLGALAHVVLGRWPGAAAPAPPSPDHEPARVSQSVG